MNRHDDDTDPTGMRELLRSLPDPGPMPEHLVARIHASLADLEPLDGAAHAPADVPRGTVSPGRSSWWGRHGGKLAVAAVLLVGGGAVASGPLGLLSGSTTGGESQSAAGRADDDSGGGDTSGGGESGRQEGLGQTSADAAADVVEGPVVVRMSGRAYTATGLASQLDGLEQEPPIGPLTAESPPIGPIGTELGVRSCLDGLGLPTTAAVEVDLGFLDGTPAAVLVLTTGGERTAYAVGRACTREDPSLLAGPVTLP